MQNIIEFTSVWYNLPFTLMLVATLVLCLLQLIGLDGDAESGDGDADAEMGEADHEIEISPLAIIGFGKAPTLLVLSIEPCHKQLAHPHNRRMDWPSVAAGLHLGLTRYWASWQTRHIAHCPHAR